MSLLKEWLSGTPQRWRIAVKRVCLEADAKLRWNCPGLAVSQLCKRLYYAGHSVALLKTCSKYFQCPVSLGLNLEHNHRSVLSKSPIRPCLFPAQPQHYLCLSGRTENDPGRCYHSLPLSRFSLYPGHPSKTEVIVWTGMFGSSDAKWVPVYTLFLKAVTEAKSVPLLQLLFSPSHFIQKLLELFK